MAKSSWSKARRDAHAAKMRKAWKRRKAAALDALPGRGPDVEHPIYPTVHLGSLGISAAEPGVAVVGTDHSATALAALEGLVTRVEGFVTRLKQAKADLNSLVNQQIPF